MPRSNTKVLIVGGGAAGITAAIGLAKRDIPVVVLEGGLYAGAENWSGAVYFCENLVRPEILGEDGLAQTPVERRVVQRGLLASDGELAVGASVRSPAAFNHCYTVLRPVFDHDLAEKARIHGAEILTGTTALALLRDGDRVRGVLTDRGPIYADVVFLAEGDASNLVTREGLETKNPGESGIVRPEFLQGIKEVLQLPEGEIERRFGVQEGEGACFEILLRNGTVKGATAPLNAGAFLYTNRDSLSIGLVAPLHNLKQVGVRHNQLMEWLKGMPALEGLLDGARPVSFGAKLIRGGGFKEMPRLALDGCAVGGAATGIGLDFPCPNYTGPATFMGWAFSEAVADILDDGGAFTREALEARYVETVQSSSYLTDVHSLKDWPAFVSETRHFFDTQVDVATAMADAATNPERSGHLAVARAALDATSGHRKALMAELNRAGAALGLTRGLGKDILLAVPWWVINCVIGWFPRRTSTDATLVPHLLHGAGVTRESAPWLIRYVRWIMAPGLAEALHHLYRNDGAALPEKLRASRRALLNRISLVDLVLAPLLLLVLTLLNLVARRRETDRRTALDQVSPEVDHDSKLAWLTYRSDEHTHIRFHAAYDEHGLPDDASSSLFNVCPAWVYKQEDSPAGDGSVAVLHENCIRCETCWRADDRRVDWGRTRGQRLVFESYTSADAWLRESREAANLARAARAGTAQPIPPIVDPDPVALDAADRADASAAGTRISRHLRSFRSLMRHMPSVLLGSDRKLLDALGREVIRGVEDLGEALGRHDAADLKSRRDALAGWVRLATDHLDTERFFHFEADLGVLESHHMVEVRALTGVGLSRPPRRASFGMGARRAALRALLEQRLDRDTVAACEASMQPTDDARRALLDVVAALCDPDSGEPVAPGSVARDAALEEMARLSPSLAVLTAGHLAVCDLVHRAETPARPVPALSEVRDDLRTGRVIGGILRGEFWLNDDAVSGQSEACLLGGLGVLALPTGDGFCLLVPGDDGVTTRIVGGLGLRGAGPGTVTLDAVVPRAFFSGEPAGDWLRERACWDLVAVARGMSAYLLERALDHAASRVQFPGMFKDHRGRDSIAKFGAVQEMLGVMTENQEVLEALRDRAGMGRPAAALAINLLGPSPRSTAYLAGQVLGGTAYSEEDPVCRFFRDAATLTRLPIHLAQIWGEVGDTALGMGPEGPDLPDLDMEPRPLAAPDEASRLVATPIRDVDDAVRAFTAAVGELEEADRAALRREVGRLTLDVAAVRALASRVEARLEDGARGGISSAALEGLCERTAARARRLTLRLGDVPALCELGRQLLDNHTVSTPPNGDGATYGDYLSSDGSFTSGDLLMKPSQNDLVLTPELIHADPELAALKQQIDDTWKSRYRDRRPGEEPYTRYVERLHHVPLTDIRTLLDEGYFRLIIPTAHGGEGAKKVAYYLATTAMMRHGDPTQAIIVMGSTSIGTTPLLLGLEQDLPEARRTLTSLMERRDEVEAAAAGDGQARKALRSLLGNKAVRGLLPRDHRGWEAKVQEELDSLPGREAAHAFFLRLIASGSISAFALTEPSAGSDTARVRTKAELCHVPVEADPRGFWTFRPEGAPEDTVRNLFTYDSLEFADDGITFVGADGQRTPLDVRDFDHQGDVRSSAESKHRYVVLDGERIDVHDIGRVTEQDGATVYPYYRVNGAKMWITNGSTAGVMILYARTGRGPTGFMLDAHAEGLVIGKDEEKMGQRGSATNELALSDVRIPRDQVIGIEGRGQENALETLNVGRAGLAVSCTGLIQEVVEDLRAHFSDDDAEPTPEQLLELGKIALDAVNAESLGWQLAGRFDHGGTVSVRMESALAKASNTEAYHRVLTRAERVLSPRFVLDDHELEKRRRDARVLTIYEGTSEIQRFLMLRDLVDGLREDQGQGAPETELWGPFSAARGDLFKHVGAVQRGLGPRAWQQAGLQPVVFPLVEGLMALGGYTATVQRLQVAERLLDENDPAAAELLGFIRRAAQLSGEDLERRRVSGYARHQVSMERLREGTDVHARTLADRALLRHADPPSPVETMPTSSITRPVRVALIIDPRPVVAPTPRLHGGTLREHAAELSDLDRGILSQLRRLRATADAAVDVTVVGVGRIATMDVLRETLALGADRAFLLNTGTRNLFATDVAGAIAELVRANEELGDAAFDVVLGAADRGSLLLPLARRLELVPFEGSRCFGLTATTDQLEFQVRPSRGEDIQLAGPCLLTIEDPRTAAEFTWSMEGWGAAQAVDVTVVDFIPEDAPSIRLEATISSASSEVPAEVGPMDVTDAAAHFAEATGLDGAPETRGFYEGEITRMPPGMFFHGLGAVAVAEADQEGGVATNIAGPANAASAAAAGGPLGALLIVPSQDPDVVRRAAGETLAVAPGSRVGVVAWEGLMTRSVITRAQIMEGLLREHPTPAFFATRLRSAALLSGEGRALAGEDIALVDGVDRVGASGKRCTLSGLRYDRKIRYHADSDGASPHVVVASTVETSEAEADPAPGDGAVILLDELPLPNQEDVLGKAVVDAEQQLGVSLEDAEFIIDVGYGVGSRDGIEEVIEPLQQALIDLGVKGVTIGATRKVTQDLGILPDSHQIGQTGVSVDPRVMLCVGVSGAPQHLEYIGDRAVIFAFNKDADAPLMTLNGSRPKPVVYPIVGDLFQQVPLFVRALEERSRGQ